MQDFLSTFKSTEMWFHGMCLKLPGCPLGAGSEYFYPLVDISRTVCDITGDDNLWTQLIELLVKTKKRDLYNLGTRTLESIQSLL